MKNGIKLILVMGILLMAVLISAGCVNSQSGTKSTSDSTETLWAPDASEITSKAEAEVTVSRPTSEEAVALAMLTAFMEQYAVSGGNGNRAYINLKEYYDSTASGYLWSNFSGVGMQYYVCKLYPDDVAQKETFRLMINNFLYFKQRDPSENAAQDSVKYHSGRGAVPNRGQGDCFFDDNIWVARNYLRAYEILGDEWYLEEAIRVNNWVLSGWNQELGGIVWSEVGLTDSANEQHLERGLSANACGIIVNAQLAALAKTEEEKAFYLVWAEKFYNFCKKMQNTPQSYDYWNGIHTVIVNGMRKDGTVNKVHYSYNSGSMILANLALYDVEEDSDKKAMYMEDAVKTAAAAKRTFLKTDPRSGKKYYQGDPWFAAILHEAYFELAKYDKALGKSYLETFRVNVLVGYGNRDVSTGLLPYQANMKVDLTWANRENLVLHQVGFVQQAVMMALYSIGENA